MGSESKGLSSSSSSSWSPATKKMIQNLKEIVNCPESEIYAVLRDCDMNPDDAVQRLLNQDTFHQVKSKRERRKEMKETQESRPRVNYNSSTTRGTRGSSERGGGWSGTIQRGYEENGNHASNPKGENLAVAPSMPPTHTSSHVKGENPTQQPLAVRSAAPNTDSRGQSVAEASLGYQPAWVGTSTGQFSMADIVKMGRLTFKDCQIPPEVSSHMHPDDRTKVKLHHDLHPKKASNVSGMIESDYTICQNQFLDDRIIAEQQTATSGSSTLETSNVLNNDGSGVSESSHSHGVKTLQGNLSDGSLTLNSLVTASASTGLKSASIAAGASHCDDSEAGSISNCSDPDYSAALTNDVVAVSDTAEKLLHLNVGEEPENQCAVVLPSHLQALAADCSHLSFGTFRSGNNVTSTALSPSGQSNDFQETSTTVYPLSRNMGHAVADESLESSYSTCTDAISYNLAAASAEEGKELDVSNESFESDFIRPSRHDSFVENIAHSSAELSFARTDPIIGNNSIQNQPHTISESQPNDVLMPKLNSLREIESHQAQFLSSQSIPRHGYTTSSFSTTTTLSEDRQLPPGAFSLAPPPGAFSLAPPPSVIPNHPRIPLYSQSKPAFEQLTNSSSSYSGLPQSYSQFTASFQQQAYPGHNEFHQSMSDLKNFSHYSASMSRYPGASGGTGYGGYRNSSNILESYPYNAPPPMVANSGYDGGFQAQYSDRDLLTSLQQNSNLSTWNHGSSSRMQASSAQELAFQSLLEQNQQYAAYRQEQQQPSQYHSALGHANRYQSQLDAARDNQQQLFGGSTGGNGRDILSHQLHQFWQQR